VKVKVNERREDVQSDVISPMLTSVYFASDVNI
jgi:hypothetical protein